MLGEEEKRRPRASFHFVNYGVVNKNLTPTILYVNCPTDILSKEAKTRERGFGAGRETMMMPEPWMGEGERDSACNNERAERQRTVPQKTRSCFSAASNV